ncbi:hypothetical protein BMG05_01045 [Mycobacterium malmoense]|nr:hypothetical protein BMG05_01045 [Mycobacterium malmoense]
MRFIWFVELPEQVFPTQIILCLYGAKKLVVEILQECNASKRPVGVEVSEGMRVNKNFGVSVDVDV